MLENFPGRENAAYLEELYGRWLSNPSSLEREWRVFFSLLSSGDARRTAPGGEAAYKQSRVDSLIWAYRNVGYLYARLNPLVGYLSADLNYLYRQKQQIYERLTLEEFGLSRQDLDRVFLAGSYLRPSPAPLREILKALSRTYCSTVGVEFLHIQNAGIRRWLLTQMETSRNHPPIPPAWRRTSLEDLIKAEEFERYLHSQYVGQKRFSLEGSEVLIPALHYLVDAGARRGAREIILGMSHRGRLNVLANILDKPPEELFSTFEAVQMPGTYGGSGDVKYHLGYRRNHLNPDGSFISLALVPNPSHLESVDPVVEGLARASQDQRGDSGRKQVIPVLVHGDAAFSGQGVVAELLNLSQLNGYRSGGTIHIVVNNQIGFTTATRDARSTFFPTDIVKMMQVPVFHVNGDDPDAVIHLMNLALNYRQEFGQDVVVDIFCFRRHGHNEGDEPSFTHPRMYRHIQEHPGVATLYGDRLERSGVVAREEQEQVRNRYREMLKTVHAKRHAIQEPGENSFAVLTAGESLPGRNAGTGVPAETLKKLASRFLAVPEGLTVHRKLKRILDKKAEQVARGGPIDYPLAEHLAFASLLVEGTPVRLSGEDSQRGTFSQRHAVWWDTESDEPRPYVPLNHRRRTRPASRCTTARCRSTPCWVSSTGTPWREQGRWCCGRRSSVISATAPR
ncbi:MAG: thiamine pyrophosphate-dependent enzyme [Spirochaetota bacterium]